MVGKERTQSNLRLRMSLPLFNFRYVWSCYHLSSYRPGAFITIERGTCWNPNVSFWRISEKGVAPRVGPTAWWHWNISPSCAAKQNKTKLNLPQISYFRTILAPYTWVLSKFKCTIFPVVILSMLIAWTNGYSGAGHAAQYARRPIRGPRGGAEKYQ